MPRLSYAVKGLSLAALRTLAGLPWHKRRAGCYVRQVAASRLRLVLRRDADGRWRPNAVDPRRVVLWQGAAEPDAEAAARAALRWLERLRQPPA